MRRPSPLLLLWIALLLALGACERESNPPLEGADAERLVDFLELSRIRILAQENPDSALVRLHAFTANTDSLLLERQLERLMGDPSLSRRFMQALHDSLKASVPGPGSSFQGSQDSPGEADAAPGTEGS